MCSQWPMFMAFAQAVTFTPPNQTLSTVSVVNGGTRTCTPHSEPHFPAPFLQTLP